MAFKYSESDRDEIHGAANLLWDYFGRLGGAAMYRGMRTADIYLYVAARLLERHAPSFKTADFVDERFEAAAEKSLQRALDRLAAVKAEGAALLAQIFEFVRDVDARLKPEERSERWGEYIGYLERLPLPISREDARGIAAAHVAGKGGAISEVLAAGEGGARSPEIYDPKKKIDLSRCWVAYQEKKREPGVISFESSVVVLVSKETGRILYYGSAHDEG
jgi:hypothetical protein